MRRIVAVRPEFRNDGVVISGAGSKTHDNFLNVAPTSLGCSKTVPGCSSAWKSKTLSLMAVVGRIFPPFEDEWGDSPTHDAGPPQVFAQAALASSCWTLLPLMAIRRGFMASGISRTSSIFSSPLSNEAFLTWT